MSSKCIEIVKDLFCIYRKSVTTYSKREPRIYTLTLFSVLHQIGTLTAKPLKKTRLIPDGINLVWWT